MLTFDYNNEEKILRCIFKGRMDAVISAQISSELESKFMSLTGTDDRKTILEETLIFDLKEVNFISSSFIRICVAAGKRVKQGCFSIENCDPFIKKTFKIAGLDDILNVK